MKTGTNALNFNEPKHLGLESFMTMGMHRVLEFWVPDLPEGWWTFQFLYPPGVPSLAILCLCPELFSSTAGVKTEFCMACSIQGRDFELLWYCSTGFNSTCYP